MDGKPYKNVDHMEINGGIPYTVHGAQVTPPLTLIFDFMLILGKG